MTDRGVQVERTALAWHRTGLSALVATIIVIRYGVARHEAVYFMAAVFLATAAAFSLAVRGYLPSLGSLWRIRLVSGLIVVGTVLVAFRLLTG
jgi:hypothetical protein